MSIIMKLYHCDDLLGVPKPEQHPYHLLTGEFRAPKKGEYFWGVVFQKVAQATHDFLESRWILKPKADITPHLDLTNIYQAIQKKMAIKPPTIGLPPMWWLDQHGLESTGEFRIPEMGEMSAKHRNECEYHEFDSRHKPRTAPHDHGIYTRWILRPRHQANSSPRPIDKELHDHHKVIVSHLMTWSDVFEIQRTRSPMSPGLYAIFAHTWAPNNWFYPTSPVNGLSMGDLTDLAYLVDSVPV